MNRKVSTLFSLGISIVLITGTIWLLFNHHNSLDFGNGRWVIPHHMTIGGGGMGVIMIVFWLVVSAFIVLIISGIFSGSLGKRKNSESLEILKNRYAKGEIDKTQYQAMKRELLQH